MCVLKYIYFLAVLCKTTTWNHRNLRRLRTETAENIYFPFGSQRCLHMYTYVLLRLRCGAVKDGKPMQPFSKIIIKNINSFLNGHRPWRCHPICLRTQISIFLSGIYQFLVWASPTKYANRAVSSLKRGQLVASSMKSLVSNEYTLLNTNMAWIFNFYS